MADSLGTDLRLRFDALGRADLVIDNGDIEAVSSRDNLVQALTMRLLVYRGELTGLGHPRYGSRLRNFIGQPLDTANLELLRRYVRRTLFEDPRVADITELVVRPRPSEPGTVEVQARVTPVEGDVVVVGIMLDLG